MSVYVLVGECEYDGSDVLGVYETRDSAMEARRKYAVCCEEDTEVSMTVYDRFEIYPCVMGAFPTSGLHREVI